MLLTAKGGNHSYHDFKNVTSSPLHAHFAVYMEQLLFSKVCFLLEKEKAWNHT